jgi:nucleotide-binding universal stress UspA family protein
MRHIMVATDGSEGADRAVGVAAAIAKSMASNLLIFTVGGNLTNEELRQLARAEGDLGGAIESLSNGILARAKDRAQQIGASHIKVQSAWGDAADAIIKAVRREHVDAIVIGRRGRGRLAGLLLGSVSQKVASLAPCAVIVVP